MLSQSVLHNVLDEDGKMQFMNVGLIFISHHDLVYDFTIMHCSCMAYLWSHCL